MRRLWILLLFIPLVPAQAETAAITELLPDPGTGREFIEIHAPGIDLTGWSIADAAGNTYTFATDFGDRVVVWGGGEADGRGPAWSRATVWNNAGDVAYLYDATGALVDVLAYGSATHPHGGTVHDAPPTGQSLTFREGTWIHAAPTPGTTSQEQGASMSAEVVNVPPSVALTTPPEAEPGAIVDVTVHVTDDNGDAVAWTLQADGVLVANGSAGDHQVSVPAPMDRDVMHLLLTATDSAGNTATTSADVTIVARGLVVVADLHFPAFPPGAAEVVTLGNASIRNDGAEPVTPLIDVSDLAGPQVVPVAGRLDIGIDGTWIAYAGPLTELPTIAPGQAVSLQFRLRDVPVPLAAGTYGTSFAVIA